MLRPFQLSCGTFSLLPSHQVCRSGVSYQYGLHPILELISITFCVALSINVLEPGSCIFTTRFNFKNCMLSTPCICVSCVIHTANLYNINWRFTVLCTVSTSLCILWISCSLKKFKTHFPWLKESVIKRRVTCHYFSDNLMKHNSPTKAPNLCMRSIELATRILRVLMNRCWWEWRGVKVRVGWRKLRNELHNFYISSDVQVCLRSWNEGAFLPWEVEGSTWHSLLLCHYQAKYRSKLSCSQYLTSYFVLNFFHFTCNLSPFLAR